MVFATAPLSAGKSFVKSEFRLITVLASGATSPANLKTAYEAKFGSLGSIGQKIFVEIKPVNTITGQVGGTSQASVISAT
jgi:hypothetical protein